MCIENFQTEKTENFFYNFIYQCDLGCARDKKPPKPAIKFNNKEIYLKCMEIAPDCKKEDAECVADKDKYNKLILKY